MKKLSLLATCTLGVIMTAATPVSAASSCIKTVQGNQNCKAIICDTYNFCNIEETLCKQIGSLADLSNCTIISKGCSPCASETEAAKTGACSTDLSSLLKKLNIRHCK